MLPIATIGGIAVIEQLTNPDIEQFLSTDDIYLAELAERITKLRMLHEQMDTEPQPWGWVKSFSE